jgi:hypothetical protein
MYEHGVGVPQDLAESVRWDRIAAQHGYPRALNNLGYLYEHGLGVTKDFPQAAKLYCEAAGSHLPEAEHNWESIRSNIRDVPKECAEAAQWLARFAPHGIENGESIEAGSKTRD